MLVRNLICSVVCSLMLFVGGVSDVARADAATATVTPASGGNGVPLVFGHAEFDLADVGYTREEFFVEGTADAYAPVNPLTNDGKWTVAAVSPAAYKTRMVVNRPVDAREFNGTVVVEWFNVSGGADASPDWQHMHVELIRQGYVWVGVSAQFVGLNQLTCPTLGPGCPAPGDPARYGSLSHPGDSHSYDIFSQVGQAVRDQAALVLGGLEPERVIATGESQSAGRLTTYINAAHPVDDVYDAFVVHSRGASGSSLSQSPLASVPTPTPTFIRDDLDVPVMVFANENDRGSLVARQPDGPLYRLWEATGTAHFGYYGLVLAANDTGARETVSEWFDSMLNPTASPSPNFSCALPINTGPATYGMRALIRALNTWLVDGTPAPMAPRFDTISVSPAVYNVDSVGNVLGGIRHPAVDAPVARINGLGQETGGTPFCSLFGITEPLTEAQLTDLYGDRDGFVSAWQQATQDAVQAGFLLKEDAQQIRVVGAQSDVLN